MAEVKKNRAMHVALWAMGLLIAIACFGSTRAYALDEHEADGGSGDPASAQMQEAIEAVSTDESPLDVEGSTPEAVDASNDGQTTSGDEVVKQVEPSAIDDSQGTVTDDPNESSSVTGEQTTQTGDASEGGEAFEEAGSENIDTVAVEVSASNSAQETDVASPEAVAMETSSAKTTASTTAQSATTNAKTAQSVTKNAAKTAPATIKTGWYSIKTLLNSAFRAQVKGNNSRAGTKICLQKNGRSTGQAFKIVKSGSYYRLMAGTGFKSRILMASTGAVALGQSKGSDSLFQILQNDDGSLIFVNKATGLALAVKGGKAKSGAYLYGKSVGSTSSQGFSLVSRHGIIKQGIYLMRTGLSGKRAIGSKSGSLKVGSKATIAKYQKKLYQKWQIKAVSGKSNAYTIENIATGYRIASTSAKAAKLKAATGAKNQMWTPVGAHGQVFFKNLKTGKMLALKDAKSSAGTVIECLDASTNASARWALKKVAVMNTGFYQLNNAANTALSLEVKDTSDAEGANVRVGSSTGTDNQIWLYNAKDKTFTSVSSGKALGMNATSAISGTNVAQYAATNTNAQKWTVTYLGGGNFKIASKLGGSLVLNAAGQSAGSNVNSTTNANAAAQKWHPIQLSEAKTSEVAINLTLAQMAQLQKSGNPTYSSTTLSYLKSVLNPKNGSKYKFVDLRKGTGLTGAQLNAFINTNGSHGKMAGLGSAFASACKKYGLNEAYMVAHAILESGWGTSELASGYYYKGGYIDGTYYKKGTYYNFFGIGAYDSSPLSGGRKAAIINGWNSPSKAVSGAAKWISTNYTYRADYAQPTLYAMKWDYTYTIKNGTRGWHQYATSLTWADSIGRLIEQCYAAAGVNPSLTYIKPKYK